MFNTAVRDAKQTFTSMKCELYPVEEHQTSDIFFPVNCQISGVIKCFEDFRCNLLMWELLEESWVVSSWSFTDCRAIGENQFSALHSLIRTTHGFLSYNSALERYNLMNKKIVSAYWNLLIAPKTRSSIIKACVDLLSRSDISDMLTHPSYF